MSKFEPVKKYKKEIDSWESVIVTSVLAAIGANLTVSGLAVLFEKQDALWMISIGISLCTVTIILYFYRRLKQLENKESISGFVIIDNQNQQIVHVPEYEISKVMWLYMTAATKGDEEIKKAWSTLNEIEKVQYSKEKSRFVIKQSEANKLIREMLEYWIIDTLSTTLISYFADYSNDKIDIFNREDVPNLLNENRLLKWISDEKPELIKKLDKTGEFSCDKSVMNAFISSTEGIYLYSRLEMKLPKKSTIEIKDDTIFIKHPFFSITVGCTCGSDASLPEGFAQYYMGIEKQDTRYKTIHFNISVHVMFKIRALIFRRWGQYFLWIDRFIEKLRELMSEDDFFEKIGWRMAYTIIHCDKQIESTKSKANTERVE